MQFLEDPARAVKSLSSPHYSGDPPPPPVKPRMAGDLSFLFHYSGEIRPPLLRSTIFSIAEGNPSNLKLQVDHHQAPSSEQSSSSPDSKSSTPPLRREISMPATILQQGHYHFPTPSSSYFLHFYEEQ